MDTTAQKLWTRYEHGQREVIIRREGRSRRYEVGGREFRTFQGLLTHLGAPHMSFRRYFRLSSGMGKGTLSPVEMISRVPDDLVVVSRRGPAVITEPVRERGFDVGARFHEIKKLLYAGFGVTIRRLGLDMDDVLQDVAKGILSRNEGPGAWDPERGSFGSYVHMVCSSVLSNHIARVKRNRGREQTGIRVYRDGTLREVDVAEAYGESPEPVTHAFDVPLGRELLDNFSEVLRSYPGAHRVDGALAQEILPYVYQGMRRGEIAELIGVPKLTVGRALAFIRDAARDHYDVPW